MVLVDDRRVVAGRAELRDGSRVEVARLHDLEGLTGAVVGRGEDLGVQGVLRGEVLFAAVVGRDVVLEVRGVGVVAAPRSAAGSFDKGRCVPSGGPRRGRAEESR